MSTPEDNIVLHQLVGLRTKVEDLETRMEDMEGVFNSSLRRIEDNLEGLAGDVSKYRDRLISVNHILSRLVDTVGSNEKSIQLLRKNVESTETRMESMDSKLDQVLAKLG